MNESPLILVIDDDRDILTMFRVMLEYNNYRVLTAEEETGTREILNANPVDLIIMDMLLSGIDGRDICRKIKQDPMVNDVPIIMFSAHPNARETCLEAGADDFMPKPFEMMEMLEKVKKTIERSRGISKQE